VNVTNKTGSSSDDWIYYQLSYTLTLNYTYTQAIQRCLRFTHFIVHRCGLLPRRTSRDYLLPRTALELPSYLLHNLHADHTENSASIFETCLPSHCIPTVAALTTAKQLLRALPSTSSKHSFFYCCVRVSRGKHATLFRTPASISKVIAIIIIIIIIIAIIIIMFMNMMMMIIIII
jgi:hypothetical protein